MSEQIEIIDGWMEMKDFCARYGQKPGTIHKRVHDGVWPRGEIFSSPSGGLCYIHVERATKWLQDQGKLKL